MPPTGRKKTKPAKQAVLSRVCDSCGTLNAQTAESCSKCGGERFAPAWVRQLRRVNRSFAVQVTDPHPLAGGTDPRLTLYKWWPGGNAGFNINDAAQWAAVKTIVDIELAPFLGWKTAEEIKRDAAARRKQTTTLDTRARELAGQDPALIVEILKNLKLDAISEDDLPRLGETIGAVAQIMLGVDENHRRAIKELVAKLPKQGAKAIAQLSELMEELTVGQIAAVASEVRRRVGLLNLFKERVVDERTYEIRGDGSIHRLLEKAMWIVDDRYWLMFSNQQLRTVVTKELEKEDQRHKLERPDFVCGAVDNRLIVIEIKRPSHTLDVADLNQLERYVVLCKKYENYPSFDAILVGSKPSDDLRATMQVRRETFKVRTYTQLVSDTERRYSDYLTALEQES
jgi:ribosomal protein L40E